MSQKHRCRLGLKIRGDTEKEGSTAKEKHTKGVEAKPVCSEMLELQLITEAPKAGMRSHIWGYHTWLSKGHPISKQGQCTDNRKVRINLVQNSTLCRLRAFVISKS